MRPSLLALGAIVIAWATAPGDPPATRIGNVRIVNEAIAPLDASPGLPPAVLEPVTAGPVLPETPAGREPVLLDPALRTAPPLSILTSALPRTP